MHRMREPHEADVLPVAVEVDPAIQETSGGRIDDNRGSLPADEPLRQAHAVFVIVAIVVIAIRAGSRLTVGLDIDPEGARKYLKEEDSGFFDP